MHTHPAAAEQWTTGLPGLDRLIEDDWHVESSDERVVNLHKTDKNGNKETKVFHKP